MAMKLLEYIVLFWFILGRGAQFRGTYCCLGGIIMSLFDRRASNSSDVIHPTIFNSLYGWLLTLTTHVSISGLRGFISRFILFISESLEIYTSRRNNVGVHDDQPRRLSVQNLMPSLHTLYAYLTGLLVTLVGIKYQSTGGDPLGEHPTLTTLFLVAIFVYFMALITLTRSNHMSDHSSKLMVGVCHISGALSCELLLLVLVSPIKSLVIIVSSPTLIVMLVSCYNKYLRRPHLFRADQETEISQTASDQVDLEAPPATSAA